MKLWRSVMKLPQPLKGCLVAYLIVFVVAFVSIPASAVFNQGKASPVTFGAWARWVSSSSFWV